MACFRNPGSVFRTGSAATRAGREETRLASTQSARICSAMEGANRPVASDDLHNAIKLRGLIRRVMVGDAFVASVQGSPIGPGQEIIAKPLADIL